MSMQILIVDDSPSMLQMIRLTLDRAGYQVVEACDGAEALQKAQTLDAGMVITDLNMPVMDGLSLIVELRRLPRYRGVPIVLLTAATDQEKRRQARLAGATGWITKPFKQEQLLAVVRKVTE